MAMDTGASISTIPAETALSLGCSPSEAKDRAEIVAAGSIVYAPMVKIPAIEFLGFKFENIEMACMDLPSKSSVMGLLGLNLLNRFDLLIRFPKGELTLRG